MTSDHPLVTMATMSSWGPAYPKIARWIGTGLRQIEVRADVLYLDASPRSSTVPSVSRHLLQPREANWGGERDFGHVREVELGLRRARWAIPHLAAYLKRERPSMTIATPGTIGTLVQVAGTLAGQPVVPWVSTIPRMDAKNIPLYLRPHRLVSNHVYRHAAAVAAVSEGVRDALEQELPAGPARPRLVVIPNPIDVDEIHRDARPLAARSARLRLCAVGRLVSAKGFDVLIEAVGLASLGRAWELLIVGEGPLRSALERLVVDRGLEEHVRLLGFVDNPYPLLASADIAVQPSRWEGFGLAILEALALGVPQVAADCPGGVAAVLGQGEYGLLVRPDSAAELAAALERLADDRQLRDSLAERGPARVADFTPSRVAQQVVNLARQIEDDVAGNNENVT